MKLKARAFTLIELLVVIAIMSLLASIIIGSVQQARAKSRDSKRVQDLVQLRNALELYRTTNGRYPLDPNPDDPNCEGGTAPCGLSCWECNLASFSATETKYADTANKLSALSPFISPRPSDPLVPSGGVFTDTSRTYKGYWYKTNSAGTEYKIAIVNTVENLNNIPETMRDQGFDNEHSLPNNMSVYSSNNSKCWLLWSNPETPCS